jgi:hypothetical protein
LAVVVPVAVLPPAAIENAGVVEVLVNASVVVAVEPNEVTPAGNANVVLATAAVVDCAAGERRWSSLPGQGRCIATSAAGSKGHADRKSQQNTEQFLHWIWIDSFDETHQQRAQITRGRLQQTNELRHNSFQMRGSSCIPASGTTQKKAHQ